MRKFVPQLRKENMEANQPVLELLGSYAERKNVTMAQISLSWMLHKYPNVVPIPGSKNQQRILENLGAWNNIADRGGVCRTGRCSCTDYCIWASRICRTAGQQHERVEQKVTDRRF